MNIFEPVVRFFYNLTGNFGWTIIICVAIDFLMVLPFKIIQRNNEKKKKKVAPQIGALKQKYHINNLGPYKDDDATLDPEIRAMDLGTRQNEMNKEVVALYKEVGYRAFTGWIPTILTLVITILIYFGISAACPEGIYSAKFIEIINNGISTNVFGFVVIILNMATSLCVASYAQFGALSKKKKKGIKITRKDVLLALIGVALPVGISIYISFISRVAIISVIFLVQILTFAQGLITNAIERHKNTTGNAVPEDLNADI